MKGIILCAMLVLCASAEAQQPKKLYRIALFSPAHAVSDLEGFRRGLSDLGYIEGKTIDMEYRFGEGRPERLPGLADELVRLNPDIIVALGTATDAIKKRTQTIPVVMVTSGDPVARGLVASLARPGGNVTGLNVLAPELSGKWLELLKETVLNLSRIAVLHNPTNPIAGLTLNELRNAAQEWV